MTAPSLAGHTDRELVAAAVAGRTEATGVLFERHRDRITATAARTGAYDVDAVVGDVALRLVTSLGTWRGTSEFTTWLHRVTLNVAYSQHSRARDIPFGPDLIEDRLMGGADDPGLAGVDAALTARRLLRDVPNDQAVAAVLVEAGMSVGEAATRLGVAAGTVKSRRARGLAAARACAARRAL